MKYSDGESKSLICSGRKFDFSNNEDYREDVHDNFTPSRHFTFMFNLFVMLQVINFFNARKLKDEMNTFGGILNSFTFLAIVIIIVIL